MNELQARVAALLGQESALFLPTATLANQIALKLHSRPGDVLVAERHAHVVIYEYGGAAAHAGLMIESMSGSTGASASGARRGRAEHEGSRPARHRARAREHPQLVGRPLLAARRARGPDDAARERGLQRSTARGS